MPGNWLYWIKSLISYSILQFCFNLTGTWLILRPLVICSCPVFVLWQAKTNSSKSNTGCILSLYTASIKSSVNLTVIGYGISFWKATLFDLVITPQKCSIFLQLSLFVVFKGPFNRLYIMISLLMNYAWLCHSGVIRIRLPFSDTI